MRTVRVTYVTNKHSAPLYSFCSRDGEWFHLSPNFVKMRPEDLEPGVTTGYVAYRTTPNMGWYEFTQAVPSTKTKADAKTAILMGNKWEPAHYGIKQMNPNIFAFKKTKEGTLFLGPGSAIDLHAIVAFYDTDGLYTGAVELLQETPGDSGVPAYSLLCLNQKEQLQAIHLYSRPTGEEFLDFRSESSRIFSYRFIYRLVGEEPDRFSSVWIP